MLWVGLGELHWRFVMPMGKMASRRSGPDCLKWSRNKNRDGKKGSRRMMSRKGGYHYRRVRMNQPREIMFLIIYQHGTFVGSSSFDHWRAPTRMCRNGKSLREMIVAHSTEWVHPCRFLTLFATVDVYRAKGCRFSLLESQDNKPQPRLRLGQGIPKFHSELSAY